MTMYRCIKCESGWEVQNGDEDQRVSGSLCLPCLRETLTPLFRRRQLREGHFDCFGTAASECDQAQCVYRKFCIAAH